MLKHVLQKVEVISDKFDHLVVIYDDGGDKVGDSGVLNVDRPPQPGVLCSRSPSRCSSCLCR